MKTNAVISIMTLVTMVELQLVFTPTASALCLASLHSSATAVHSTLGGTSRVIVNPNGSIGTSPVRAMLLALPHTSLIGQSEMAVLTEKAAVPSKFTDKPVLAAEKVAASGVASKELTPTEILDSEKSAAKSDEQVLKSNLAQDLKNSMTETQKLLTLQNQF